MCASGEALLGLDVHLPRIHLAVEVPPADAVCSHALHVRQCTQRHPGVRTHCSLVAAAPPSMPSVTATFLQIPPPTNLSSYYTAYPAPISILRYLDAIFKCKGEFALCSFATCVKIPNSNPPVAECGCYAFNEENIGFGSGILKQPVKTATRALCSGNGRCLLKDYNVAPFCKGMNAKTMYPGKACRQLPHSLLLAAALRVEVQPAGSDSMVALPELTGSDSRPCLLLPLLVQDTLLCQPGIPTRGSPSPTRQAPCQRDTISPSCARAAHSPTALLLPAAGARHRRASCQPVSEF